MTQSGGGQIRFWVHLHGPDEALTGASSNGGQVTGDFVDGILRLNIMRLVATMSPAGYSYGAASASSAMLLDCTVAPDGQSATGFVFDLGEQVTLTRSNPL